MPCSQTGTSTWHIQDKIAGGYVIFIDVRRCLYNSAKMKRARKNSKSYDKKKTGNDSMPETRRKSLDAKRKPTFLTAGDRGITSASTLQLENDGSGDDIEAITCACQAKQLNIIQGEDDDTDDDLDSVSSFSQVSDPECEANSIALCQSVYIKACNRIGIVPSSFFFKHLTETSLVMPHHGIGPRGAKAVAIALVPNTTIRKLDLSNNGIGSEGLAHILDMMSATTAITELNVSGNSLLSCGARLVKEVLSANRTLTNLDLSENGFTETDAEEISKFLMRNRHIRHLAIKQNSFGENGGIAIGKALEENTTLRSLDLSWNHLRQKGAVAICWSLYRNYTLKSLNVSWNGFGMEGCHEMGKALMKNRSLTELDLSANRVCLDAFRQLLRGITRNKKLKTLRIGVNPITTDGATAILRAVCASDCALTEIDMKDVSVDTDFVTLLEEIQERKEIKVIYGIILRHDEIRHGSAKWVLDTDDPVAILFEYMKQKNLRLIDLLHNLDKDNSETLSRSELQQGLQNNDIPLSARAVDLLMKKLDINKDGCIDYEELTIRHKEYMRRATRLKMQADASITHYKSFDKLEQIREAVRLKIALSITRGTPRENDIQVSSQTKT